MIAIQVSIAFTILLFLAYVVLCSWFASVNPEAKSNPSFQIRWTYWVGVVAPVFITVLIVLGVVVLILYLIILKVGG